MKTLSTFTILLGLIPLFFGCAPPRHSDDPGGNVITRTPPSKHYEPAREEGELPYPVLQSSSKRYGGALQDQGADDAPPAAAPGSAVAEVPRLSVVLGPVTADNETEDGEGDAGRRIREVISEQLSMMQGLTLIDAPEERYNNDSPRPDLMAKGIRFVIKGTSSFNPESNSTTVFLRIVETRSGKVFGVASGRGASQDEAAGETTRRLIRKLERAQ